MNCFARKGKRSDNAAMGSGENYNSTGWIQWISVKERLPAPGQPVHYRTDTYRYIGHIETNGEWTDRNGRRETAKVLDWMPLE